MYSTNITRKYDFMVIKCDINEVLKIAIVSNNVETDILFNFTESWKTEKK